LHTVIVFDGPGSWRRGAFWDEYVVSISTRGREPVRIDLVVLTDRLGVERRPGADPWAVEQVSRRNLEVYSAKARDIWHDDRSTPNASPASR
jgi:hypothetical protein